MLNAEAEEGDATALGLASELAKPKFVVTLYFLSDVLDTLGALSKAFQRSELNLLHIEQLVATHITTLQELKEDPYSGGFMLQYQHYDFPSETEAVDKSDFTAMAQKYLDSLITNLRHRFPQPHLLSLLGILDPRNVSSASSGLVLELISAFSIEPPKLWNEFQSYRSSVNNFQPTTLQEAACMMWKPDVRDSMTAAFPNISKLLA